MSRVIDGDRLLDTLETRISEAKEKLLNMPDKVTLDCYNPWLETQYWTGKKHALRDLKHEIERGEYDSE